MIEHIERDFTISTENQKKIKEQFQAMENIGGNYGNQNHQKAKHLWTA